jgi:acyl-CoA synthetase (AMP-forming)/AMP-acid ligase II/acyl carrier protein
MHANTILNVADTANPAWSANDTLVHVVRHWAAIQPESTAYVYVADGKELALTYGELDERAAAIAAELNARQAPGTTALMMYPLGLDFVEAFFGCLYAGVIAVPLHPGRGKSASARLSGVVRDCGAQSVLTTSTLASALGGQLRGEESLQGLAVVQTDRVAAGATASIGASVAPPAFAVAFLQYTSGSTSQPKGTMVTHRNIMANQAMLSSVFSNDRSTVIASWLPIFHDMGLIGNVLHAAYLGVPCVLLSTLGFIKSPISWLRAIDRYKATFSGAPNFAYDMCVSKTTPEERAGLDLSHWRIAFNGAEPVRQRTLEEFSKVFEPHGFQRSAFVPTYGLAEATLVVSGTNGVAPQYFHADSGLLKEGVVAPAHNPGASQALVSNGRWEHADQNIVIVDPETQQVCPSGQVGEIWVAGSHVAAGYWKKEAATADTFGATLPGDSRRYLRTGDLGFVGRTGLFVTGRIKDLIIFRGQNIYPQDIELSVELAAPEVRPSCTAAFALEGEAGVGVVVVAELEQRGSASPELLARIVGQVQERHELPLDRLVLVRRNSVPKTTSGKIQRRKCREELVAGTFDVIADWQNPSSPSAQSEHGLHSRVGEHARRWIAKRQNLAVESVDLGASIAAFGLDSIQKVELVHSVEQAFAVSIPESSFFAFETIEDLVRAVAACKSGAPKPRQPSLPAPAPVAAPPAPRAIALPAFSAMTWEVRGD